MKIIHCPIEVRERLGLNVVEQLTWQMFVTEDDIDASIISEVWDVLDVVEVHTTRHDHAVIITAMDFDPATTTCLSVGRGLDPHAASFRARFHLAMAVSPDAYPAPHNVLLLDRGRLWHTRPREPWHGDILNLICRRALRTPRVSRAEFKWLQSIPLLRHLGWRVQDVAHWLDLGAAPGGITNLLARTASVTAIDLGELDARVESLSNVQTIKANALEWSPPSDANIDGLVCDMNGPADESAAAVSRLAATLPVGAPVVWTLKATEEETLQQVPEALGQLLGSAPIEVLRWQRLYSHRAHELVVIGRRT